MLDHGQDSIQSSKAPSGKTRDSKTPNLVAPNLVAPEGLALTYGVGCSHAIPGSRAMHLGYCEDCLW